MRRGLILSDLHLFARRSDDKVVEKILAPLTSDIDFILLNGDIIDFRWSQYGNETETIRAGLDWLRALEDRFNHGTIYYVMGNHDCAQNWANALQTLQSNRFHWSPTHFLLGDCLFVHGDLPMEGKNPFTRTHMPQSAHQMPLKPIANAAYETLLTLRGHRAIAGAFPARIAASLINRTLQKHAQPNYRHVYFGHTHNPFNNYALGDLTYHNTGSAIRLLKPNPIKVIIHD